MAGKILAFANQKGGVGKTTLVCHYALAVAQNRLEKTAKRVLVIDLDPQANCTRFLTQRKLTSDPTVGEGYTRTKDLFKSSVEQFMPGFKPYPAAANVDLIWTAKNDTNLSAAAHSPDPDGQNSLMVPVMVAKNIRAVATRYDLVIIDSAPTVSKLQLCALLAATDVACPIKMSGFGLDGAEGLMGLIKQIKSGPNASLNFRGMILNQESRSSKKYLAEIEDLRKIVSNYVFKNGIGYRRPFDQATTESRPIWKIHTGSAYPAKKEMLAVLIELHHKLFPQAVAEDALLEVVNG